MGPLLASAQGVNIVVLGSSANRSDFGATHQSLIRELEARGHDVLFLERAAAERRKKPRTQKAKTRMYRSVSELKSRYALRVRDAHVVIVGSYIRDGADVGNWVTRVAKGVTAFYDSDTSDTVSQLEHGDAGHLTRALVPKYDLYLSVTDGPALEILQREYRSPMARALNPHETPAHRAAQLERYVAEAMSGQLMS